MAADADAAADATVDAAVDADEGADAAVDAAVDADAAVDSAVDADVDPDVLLAPPDELELQAVRAVSTAHERIETEPRMKRRSR